MRVYIYTLIALSNHDFILHCAILQVRKSKCTLDIYTILRIYMRPFWQGPTTTLFRITQTLFRITQTSVREKENVPQFVSRLEGRFFFCNADIPIFIHTFAHVCAYIYTYRPFQPCLYSELRELISLYKRMCLNINPNFTGTFTWKGDVFISMYIYACVCVCTYTHTRAWMCG